jgi:hypothetical protein
LPSHKVDLDDQTEARFKEVLRTLEDRVGKVEFAKAVRSLIAVLCNAHASLKRELDANHKDKWKRPATADSVARARFEESLTKLLLDTIVRHSRAEREDSSGLSQGLGN